MAPPKKYRHLKSQKRELIQEMRYNQIEKENVRLLERMSSIMRSGSGTGIYFNPSHNNNASSKASSPALNLKANRKSLNFHMRKQQLVKITIANHKFLKRLKKTQSSYKFREYDRERKEQEKVSIYGIYICVCVAVKHNLKIRFQTRIRQHQKQVQNLQKSQQQI